MNEIQKILVSLKGTKEYDILIEMQEMYSRIQNEQSEWYNKTDFTCPSGCGNCCINFEPDLLECEALYMAAWLLENQKETALKIAQNQFPFDNGKTCPLFNKENPYHCSIYGGRSFICRLFGASSVYNKNGKKEWRPCKFLPLDLLNHHVPPVSHRDYTEQETIKLLGAVPPAMSDLMEEALSLQPDNEQTVLLRESLPKSINKLLWIISINNPDNTTAA